jgi:predicted O-methyltransferase YrrM
MEEISFRDYCKLKSKHRSLLGFGKKNVQLCFLDLFLFEKVLCNNEIQNIVEFGTRRGITSMYLGLAASLKKIKFTTYDISDERLDCVCDSWLFNMNFQKVNLLAEEDPLLVVQEISQPKTFLFIDNGNKILEIKKYCKHLQLGSIVLIHDWETEVKEKEILPFLTSLGYRALYWEESQSFKSSSRVFQRVDVFSEEKIISNKFLKGLFSLSILKRWFCK